MKALLWRLIYAAICVVMFLMIFPLFLNVVGFPMGGDLFTLLRLVVACIAVLYVIWGPAPVAPW